MTDVPCAPRCARLCTDAGMTAAYAKHAGELTAFSRRALADHGLAEEITQEVFVRAWRHCGRFDASLDVAGRTLANPLRTWLYAIARNAVIDAVRTRRRRPVLHPDPARELRLVDQRDTYARFDTADEVRSGLARLSAVHRDAVVAVFLDELTYEQAATRLGIPVGTVKSRAFYALRTLRGQMGRPDEAAVLAA